jgi:ubiquinone/menaquinone biosynthesis C-methylase UbiE
MEKIMSYQEKVNIYFQSRSSHWNTVYSKSSVYAEIIQARHQAVLDWIDQLNLLPGSQVLEVGCGAGRLAIALAERGLCVQARDANEAMVEQARRNAANLGNAHLLEVKVGNVYSLAFADDFFDLIVAVGVFPWLDNAELAIQEMARVTKPGGYLLLTAANGVGLPDLLDPQLNPALAPLRQRVKSLLELMGVQVGLPEHLPKMVYHHPSFLNKALRGAGLLKIKDKTLGFGPFTFLCSPILPNRLGLSLHGWLQHLADRNVPVLGSTGMSYHVLARKGQPPE